MFIHKLLSFLVYSIVVLGVYAIGSTALPVIPSVVYLGVGVVLAALLNPMVLKATGESNPHEVFHMVTYAVATVVAFVLLSAVGVTNLLVLVGPFAAVLLLDLLVNQESHVTA